jgi:hypothetical protein
LVWVGANRPQLPSLGAPKSPGLRNQLLQLHQQRLALNVRRLRIAAVQFIRGGVVVEVVGSRLAGMGDGMAALMNSSALTGQQLHTLADL